ncbi:hypothetical protein [Lachnobacterium bovis]|uniref:hypothetical protein n=1 Tax=Lachnobacterium bovis TaxID=140626 RepID=UPI0003B7994B|nr:hypothetical protein [Lachnobacterium bovis]
MKIMITITNPANGVGYDIQIDNKQTIKTTLKVCSENLTGLELADTCKKVRLWDGGKQISVDETYEEAGIYSGAKLIVE